MIVKIRYGNGLAIFNKRLWDAEMHGERVLALSRDGESMEFLVLDNADEEEKDCSLIPDSLEGRDRDLLARFTKIWADEQPREARKDDWRVREFMDCHTPTVAVVCWPERRVLWNGHGWNMLNASVDQNSFYTSVTIIMFDYNPNVRTTLWGAPSVPYMATDPDFGYFTVVNSNTSIESYM